jgi:hypothetical protein
MGKQIWGCPVFVVSDERIEGIPFQKHLAIVFSRAKPVDELDDPKNRCNESDN